MCDYDRTKKTVLGKGFSLIEALIASILVGMAIAALLISSKAFTMSNGAGLQLSTAEFLIEELRELTTDLPVVDPESGQATFGAESGEDALADYDDLDDFDGLTFNPPIDISRSALGNFSAFSQQITVENVSAADFSTVVADHGSDFVRVTATVSLAGRELSSTNWIRASQ